MSSDPPPPSQPEGLYYLGKVGQRTQMTRAHDPSRPLPVPPPPPHLAGPRPQLPPLESLQPSPHRQGFQGALPSASLPEQSYASHVSPSNFPQPSAQGSGVPQQYQRQPSFPRAETSGPISSFPRPGQGGPVSSFPHPALYPQRASFQSRNPGTVYEALSPIEYGHYPSFDPSRPQSVFHEASYPQNPHPPVSGSVFQSPPGSHGSSSRAPSSGAASVRSAQQYSHTGTSSPFPLVQQGQPGQPGQPGQLGQSWPPGPGLQPQAQEAPDMFGPPELRKTSLKRLIQCSRLDRYALTIRQQPIAARACGFGERDRRVIDPPPIVQLSLRDFDPTSQSDLHELHFPFNIMHCALLSASSTDIAHRQPTSAPTYPAVESTDVTTVPDPQSADRVTRRLMGTLVSSPFVGTDPEVPESKKGKHENIGVFFIFNDLSCRQNGLYRLRFTLMKVPIGSDMSESPPDKLQQGGMQQQVRTGGGSGSGAMEGSVRASIDSDVFEVFSAKDFPGMRESSRLVRELRRQGASVSVRKGRAGGVAETEREKRASSLSGDEEEQEEGGAGRARVGRGKRGRVV